MNDNPITLRSFELKGSAIIIEFTYPLNDYPQPIKMLFDRNEHNIGESLDRAIIRKVLDMRIHTLSILGIVPALPAHQHFLQHGDYNVDLISERFGDIREAWVKGNQSTHKGFPKAMQDYDFHLSNFRLKKIILDESQSHVVLHNVKVVGGQKINLTSPALNIMSEIDTDKAVSYLFYPMLRTDLEILEALCAELVNKSTNSLKRQLDLFDNLIWEDAEAAFETFNTMPFDDDEIDEDGRVLLIESRVDSLPSGQEVKELPPSKEQEPS